MNEKEIDKLFDEAKKRIEAFIDNKIELAKILDIYQTTGVLLTNTHWLSYPNRIFITPPYLLKPKRLSPLQIEKMILTS
jgi:hypothetical protein